MDSVEALLFDVFGTVVDWRSSVEQELIRLSKKFDIAPTGWERDFAQEWRNGYMEHIQRVASGGSGTLNVDEMHREILNRMLDSPHSRWTSFGAVLDETERQNLNNVWHRLNGWPDSSEGLYALKKQVVIATLSNGNVRLLVDLAKHADLPWDAVFSTELFNTFKPNPEAYLSAARHLSLRPEQCAMVAAHPYDLYAAARVGMKTIYIPRPGENMLIAEEVKGWDEGGEVDIVAGSLTELSLILGSLKKS